MNKTGFTLAAAAATLFSAGAMLLAPIAASANQDGVRCLGANACKGQSACKSGNHECKGLNACKGQGFSLLPNKAACDAAGGTVG